MTDRGISFLEMGDRTQSKRDVIGRSQYRLLMSGLRYIRAADKDKSKTPGFLPVSKNYPFALYSSRSCRHHMRSADAQGVSLNDLIRFTEWPSNQIWSRIEEIEKCPYETGVPIWRDFDDTDWWIRKWHSFPLSA